MSPHRLAIPPALVRFRREVAPRIECLALRAALEAAHLFGLAAGVFLRELRATCDPLAQTASQLKQAQLRESLAWEVVDILGARLDKIPERQRPHYSPAHRFRILEIRSFLGWSARTAAAHFRLCAHTLGNWERAADPETQTSGALVRPAPPVRRLADVVRATVQAMVRRGFGGEDMVAQVLARAGWMVSGRSVRRIARAHHRPVPAPPALPGKRSMRPVVARFVRHVWMMDVTVIRTFLGGDLHLAGVFYAFSRVPLALQVFERPPGAAAMARLLRMAARVFQAPRYVLTDRGGEFTGSVFRRMAARLGARHRFGTADRLFATARLERFWRTLKDTAGLRVYSPLTVGDLERALEATLAHYLGHRPHQGLGGATPAEVFLGLAPARRHASAAPRGRPGDGPRVAAFDVEYLDGERRRLPILKPAA